MFQVNFGRECLPLNTPVFLGTTGSSLADESSMIAYNSVPVGGQELEMSMQEVVRQLKNITHFFFTCLNQKTALLVSTS